MSPPDLTAVVIAYESVDLIERCLAALPPAAGAALSLEILVVDNGSTDGTAERAEALLARLGTSSGVLRLGANRGFAAAANAGAAAAAAGARAFAFVNTDAVPPPDGLARLVALLDAQGDVALASGRLVYPDGRSQRTAPEISTRRAPPPAPVDVSHVRGACLVANAAHFRSLGGFDERFFFYLEETDLCLRARAAALRVVVDPGVVVLHDGGAVANRRRARARVERDRGRALLRAKHHLGPPEPLARLADTARSLGTALASATAVAATLGLASSLRRRAADALYVCAWHLRGRPPGWGLS